MENYFGEETKEETIKEVMLHVLFFKADMDHKLVENIAHRIVWSTDTNNQIKMHKGWRWITKQYMLNNRHIKE